MRSFLITTVVAGASALGVAGSAAAGGYIAPVTEAPIVAPIVTAAPAGDWAGAYGGASLGYAFRGDDRVGLDLYEDGELIGRARELGKLVLSGPTATLRGGYRWQRGNWVYGPEISADFGKIEDDITIADGSVTSEVNYILSATLKTGYLVNPQTMVFGTAGVTRGDFDYTLAGPDGSATEGYTANGWTLGVGVERMINQRMSVVAAYNFKEFGRTDVTFTDEDTSVVTVATPKHHQISVGVNFSF